MEAEMGISNLFQSTQAVGPAGSWPVPAMWWKERNYKSFFYNCAYSRKNLIDVLHVTGHVLWMQMSSHVPPLRTDVRARDLMEVMQSFTRKANCWRLQWILLRSIYWHRWQERNRSLKLGSSRKREDISKEEACRDASLCFDIKSNPPDMGVIETWEVPSHHHTLRKSFYFMLYQP